MLERLGFLVRTDSLERQQSLSTDDFLCLRAICPSATIQCMRITHKVSEKAVTPLTGFEYSRRMLKFG